LKDPELYFRGFVESRVHRTLAVRDICTSFVFLLHGQ
jgi:hypothetical protein